MGKILVCGSPGGFEVAESVGTIAIIYQSRKPDVAFVHPLPACHKYHGKSVDAFNMKGLNYPLVFGKSAALSACNEETADLCAPACLDISRARGNILVCGSPAGLQVVESVGALAIIYQSRQPAVAFVHPLPASGLNEEDFEALVSYMESTE